MIGLSIAIRLGIAVIVIAAVTIPLINVGTTGPTFRIPTVTPVFTTGGGSSAAPGPASGSSKPVSYLTAVGVQAGLARISKRLPGARLASVRLAADSLIASARLPNGAFREVVFTRILKTVTPGADSGQRLIPISQVSPRAVERIVSSMRRRFHVPAGETDYMVLSSPPGAPTQWIVFAKGPRHPGFSATLTGARLKRLPS